MRSPGVRRPAPISTDEPVIWPAATAPPAYTAARGDEQEAARAYGAHGERDEEGDEQRQCQ
ncbi:hypothetical protein GCM10020001_008680 [Nonomuraea salmonea]